MLTLNIPPLPYGLASASSASSVVISIIQIDRTLFDFDVFDLDAL